MGYLQKQPFLKMEKIKTDPGASGGDGGVLYHNSQSEDCF